MAAVSHDAGVRDKRYAGHTLLVDLQDAECETKAWSVGGFTAVGASKTLIAQLAHDELMTGVFRFPGEAAHGLFEARVEEFDAERGLVGVHFMWISEEGRGLLARMAERDQVMKVALCRRTLNWSLSGLMIGGYRGELKDGGRVRGRIWTDSPKAPGQFSGHAVHVNGDRHTASIEFETLSEETFSLLEDAVRSKHRHGT